MFLFFAYVQVVIALPNTSLANAIAIAIKTPCSPWNVGQKVINSGTITVAADNPTKPVETPASNAAIMITIYSIISIILLFQFMLLILLIVVL